VVLVGSQAAIDADERYRDAAATPSPLYPLRLIFPPTADSDQAIELLVPCRGPCREATISCTLEKTVQPPDVTGRNVVDLVTIEDIIDFAIAAEIEAARAYRDLAERVEHRDVHALLLTIATEEDGHREALERVRQGDLSMFARDGDEIQLSASLAAPDLSPDLTAAQFLLAAIDAERRAYQLYRELAFEAGDPGLTTLLDALAREETRHWQRLERAYDGLIAGTPIENL
jgi:rubrerythrin